MGTSARLIAATRTIVFGAAGHAAKNAINSHVAVIMTVHVVTAMDPVDYCAGGRCLIMSARRIRSNIVAASFDHCAQRQRRGLAKLFVINDLDRVIAFRANLNFEMKMPGLFAEYPDNRALNVSAGFE